jgi:NAD(P)-dependent dehydrogenase (short-subunit alcohol dehydrogenase family)
MGHFVDIFSAICDRDHEALTTISMSALESAFRTNAFGPLILTQALLSNLTAVPNPRIGNITSRVGSIADNTGGGFYGYRGSKAALNMIGKSMAVDLKEKGVLVAMVHPGMVATPGSGAKIGQPQVIEPQEAADKCWDMLIKMGIEDTGKFWHREGNEIPW